jgi:predicted dienelactone hydrolase
MTNQKKYVWVALFAILVLGAAFLAPKAPEPTDEFIYGDLLPDAPELAKRGEYKVGVRTLDLVNKDQWNILAAKDGVCPKYDRPIKVEVWYPALAGANQQEIEIYDEVLGNNGDPKRPLIPFQFKGRCIRNAEVQKSSNPYPLVILSHGYTGSRLLFTYLSENLASKGYVVVAIDHTESTFRDAAGFQSTLLNRSLDQLFVLNEMDRLGKANSNHFLSRLVDASNTAIVGYSMGGYGALNSAGAGYSRTASQFFQSITGGSLLFETRTTGSEAYLKSQDNRIKAVVAMAPWGMANGVWDSTGLTGMKKPVLFIAGSQDDISKYEKGIAAIYQGCTNAKRYMLTYMNARHNVAPNPPPAAALKEGLHIDEYLRFADSVWDQRRMNNINQHFVTAFLGQYLKGEQMESYLTLKENANEETWQGFKPRTCVGMEWRYSR